MKDKRTTNYTVKPFLDDKIDPLNTTSIDGRPMRYNIDMHDPLIPF